MSIRRMMLAIMSTFSDLVKSLIQDIKLRVLLAYGVFEAESCLQTQLDAVNDISLLQDATIVITPNGYNEDILHTVKGNTITTPYNLSEYTEAFINIQSLGLNNTLSTTDINPFGVAKSLRIVSNAANTAHRVTRNAFFIQKTSTYTYSVYLKKGSGATAPNVMQVLIQRGGAFDVSANFNLITGVTTNPVNCTSSIDNTGLTSGWWRCSITLSINASTSISIGVVFCNNNPLAGTSPTYVDATTSDALVFGFQIENNTSATTYQPVLFTQVLERGYAQHTRSTTGHRVESTGLVREVPQENLITFSEDFSSAIWNKLNSSITVNTTLTTAPDGTNNADIINANAGSGIPLFARVPNSAAGKTYQLSIYAKANTNNFIFVRYTSNATLNSFITSIYDVSSGTITQTQIGSSLSGANIISNTIADVGDGWYRIVLLANIPQSDLNITFGLSKSGTGNTFSSTGLVNNSSAFSGTENVFLWGAQLALTNTPINYYPTLLRTNTPRIDYTDGSCPTLLLEQASTNLLVRSEEFNDGGWVKSNLTVTPNTDTAPNGLLTADTLTASSSDGFIKQLGAAVNTNLPRIFSVFLKRKTGIGNILLEMGHQQQIVTINSSNWIRCSLLNTALTSTTSISAGTYTVTTSTPHNLVTGDNIRWVNVGTTSGSGIPNGVSTTVTVTSPTQYTFTSTVTTATCNSLHYINFGKVIISTSGDEVYAWGAQLELTSTTLQSGYYEPTSYIPTINSAVTRGADITSLFKIRDNNLLNNTFSLFWEVKKIGGGASQDYHIGLTDNPGGFTSNYFIINGLPLGGRRGDNGVNLTLTSIGSYQPLSTNYYKGLITCNNGTFDVWIDGTKLSTSTMVNYDKLVALSLVGTNNGISRYKQILGWNRVLNRAEIDLLFAYPYYNAGYIPVNNELQQIINRAYAEGFTIPSTTILGYCDTLITEMKNDGVWNVSDVYYNFAYNDVLLSDFARINWKNPYGGLGLALVTPGVTATVGGFKTTPTTPVNLRFNPSLAAYNYTLNNAGRMFVIRTDATTGFYYDGDMGSGNANRLYRLGSTASEIKINSSNVFSGSGVVVDGTGLKSLMRDSSNSVRFQNKTSLHTSSQVSTALPTNFQSISLVSNGCDAEYSNYWMGASINNTQINNFRTYYNTYLTNIGLAAFA